MIQHNNTRIDADAIRVLQAICNHGGELNTSEAKTITGIDDNDIVRRRFERLEEAGLVDIRQADIDSHHIPPIVATITADGSNQADQWDVTNDLKNKQSIDDQLIRIENQLSSLESRVHDLECAANGNDDAAALRETRLLTEALRRWSVESHEADLGRHYPE